VLEFRTWQKGSWKRGKTKEKEKERNEHLEMEKRITYEAAVSIIDLSTEIVSSSRYAFE